MLGGKATVDQQLKITFRKSSVPPWKNPFRPKNSKSASLPLLANIENFSDPHAEKGGGGHCVISGKVCSIVWE